MHWDSEYRQTGLHRLNMGSLFRFVLFEVLQLLSEDDVSGTLSKFLSDIQGDPDGMNSLLIIRK